MANLYLKTCRQGSKIIKTYQGSGLPNLVEETIKYSAALKNACLKFPATEIYSDGNSLVIEQDFVEGERLNDFLKERRPDRFEVIENLLRDITGSIGKTVVWGTHWVSDNRFAIDASFSNFIVSKTADLYYVDLFPPRNLEAFLSGAIRWGELTVSIPPKRGEGAMRFKIYDARGIIFDILSHLVFYVGVDDVGRLQKLVKELSLDNELVEKTLIDINRKKKFYLDLFLGYLRSKGVGEMEIPAFEKAFTHLDMI